MRGLLQLSDPACPLAFLDKDAQHGPVLHPERLLLEPGHRMPPASQPRGCFQQGGNTADTHLDTVMGLGPNTLLSKEATPTMCINVFFLTQQSPQSAADCQVQNGKSMP